MKSSATRISVEITSLVAGGLMAKILMRTAMPIGARRDSFTDDVRARRSVLRDRSNSPIDDELCRRSRRAQHFDDPDPKAVGIIDAKRSMTPRGVF